MFKYVDSAWVAYSGGKLTASGLDVTTPPPNFGVALSLDRTGTNLAVGATGAGTFNAAGRAETGAVFIFMYASSTWTQAQLILPPASCVGGGNKGLTINFGFALSLNSDASVLAVGAPFDEQLGDEVGSTFV